MRASSFIGAVSQPRGVANVRPRLCAAPRSGRTRGPSAMATTTPTAAATDLRTALVAVVGAEHVRDDPGALLTFSTGATPPERGKPHVVVFPATTEEVAAVVRIANERRVPVIARGSGTNLSAGAVPHRGGIVLVLTRMNRLKEVSAGDLVAVCEPGVRTIELAEAAAEQGMLFPPDPGSHTTATIGGNVAECSGGLRALKYGVTRDYVLGVEAVLGTGEVIRSGGGRREERARDQPRPAALRRARERARPS